MLIDVSTPCLVIDPGAFPAALAAVILKRSPDDGVRVMEGEALEPFDELDGPRKRQAYLLRPEPGERVATFRVTTALFRDRVLTGQQMWIFTMSRRVDAWDVLFMREGEAASHRVFMADYDPNHGFEQGQTAWDRLLGDDSL